MRWRRTAEIKEEREKGRNNRKRATGEKERERERERERATRGREEERVERVIASIEQATPRPTDRPTKRAPACRTELLDKLWACACCNPLRPWDYGQQSAALKEGARGTWAGGGTGGARLMVGRLPALLGGGSCPTFDERATIKHSTDSTLQSLHHWGWGT